MDKRVFMGLIEVDGNQQKHHQITSQCGSVHSQEGA